MYTFALLLLLLLLLYGGRSRNDDDGGGECVFTVVICHVENVVRQFHRVQASSSGEVASQIKAKNAENAVVVRG